MLVSLILTSLIETLPVGPAPMACSFHSEDPATASVEIVLKGRPSLKDLPGLFRVEMDVDDRTGLRAAAQPIEATAGRDVLIRAKRGDRIVYALGIDEGGDAALNIVWGSIGEKPERRATMKGSCRNHEAYIRTWTSH